VHDAESPYYEDEFVTLYHGNCLEVGAWLDADVLITDPPYGINGALSASYKGKKKAAGFQPVHDRAVTWDATLEARDAALALWGDEKPAAVFASPKRMDAPPFQPREVPLIWDKGQLVGMGDLTFPWRVNYELIYVRGDFAGPRTATTVLRYDLSNRAASREGHPTPKPIGLMSELIIKAPAGLIADPFAGSGSTLVAAKHEGRRAVGVELDERYCEIAAKRLAQDTLFGGVA
jgi:site-specific DNA-methyltransferase (adenine-specific)